MVESGSGSVCAELQQSPSWRAGPPRHAAPPRPGNTSTRCPPSLPPSPPAAPVPPLRCVSDPLASALLASAGPISRHLRLTRRLGNHHPSHISLRARECSGVPGGSAAPPPNPPALAPCSQPFPAPAHTGKAALRLPRAPGGCVPPAPCHPQPRRPAAPQAAPVAGDEPGALSSASLSN